jgi:hypothetical protein
VDNLGDGPSNAVSGDRNSAAEGLRGICSLALPSLASGWSVGLLAEWFELKLWRRSSCSLAGARRRKRPDIRGMIGFGW